jgi:hypothetical protein
MARLSALAAQHELTVDMVADLTEPESAIRQQVV